MLCWYAIQITYCRTICRAPQAFGLIDALAAQQGMPPCTEVIDSLEGRQDVQQVLQATASYSMQAAPHLRPPPSVLQLDC